MKKNIGLICIATLLVSTAFSKHKNLPPKELETEVKHVMPFTDLTTEVTKELLEGLHPEIAVECKEGTELPFKYIGNFGLFSIHFTPNLSIKLEKNAYLRFIRLNPKKRKSLKTYISYDLKSWEQLRKKQWDGQPDCNLGFSKDKSSILLETTAKPAVVRNDEE